MRKNMYSSRSLACALVLCAALLHLSCEDEPTPSLFDPNASEKLNPVITAIEPADSSLAGVGELTIRGQNFSTVPQENLVYFNAAPAVVVAASATELRVKTPNIVADSISIRIAVQGAPLFSSTAWYKLKPAAVILSDLKSPGQDVVKAFGMDVDLDGNIYVSTELNTIKKVAPDGRLSVLKSNASFIRANALKVGPGNVLYVTNVVARLRRISTIAPDGTESVFVSLPGVPQDLDFDANSNIWVTVDTDIYLVKPDKTTARAVSYPVTLATLRVYDGYVYAAGKNAATGEAKIWRSQIQGETLGAKEVVLDIAAAPWLVGGDVLSLTFSADGEMYLGTNHPEGTFVLRPDGSHEVLYPGLVAPTVYAMSWGEGNLLFAIQQLSNTSNLIKIDVGKPGAPYYGRR